MFWLGWGKKIKEGVSKAFVKQNYLNKTETPLQTVASKVDFHDNIVAKRELFCDVVGNGDTNVPNLRYLKEKDNLGIMRLWISNIDQGKWQLEWLKKPAQWNDNIRGIATFHINSTYLDANNQLQHTTNQGFQEWTNFTIPNWATSQQINNPIFKDNTKVVFIYFYIVLSQELGGRIIKISQPLTSKYDRTNYEFTIPVIYTPRTKDIKKVGK